MNTREIMQMALDLSGIGAVPPDSDIVCPVERVRRVLLAIDVTKENIHRAKFEGYDLLLVHHPMDPTRFVSVMERQVDLLLKAGVHPDRAASAFRQNRAVYERIFRERNLPNRHILGEWIDLVRSTGVGFMNIHQPCDEIGRKILQELADVIGASASVSRLIERYQALPEMTMSGERVHLVCGDPDMATGRTVVVHGAGTNGGYPVANTLFEHGVGTVVYIHLDAGRQADQLKTENKGNLIVTGHYASDSLGINPLVDALESTGVEVTCCDKMIRVNKTGSNRVPGD